MKRAEVLNGKIGGGTFLFFFIRFYPFYPVIHTPNKLYPWHLPKEVMSQEVMTERAPEVKWTSGRAEILFDELHRNPFVEWNPTESIRIQRGRRVHRINWKSWGKPKLRKVRYMWNMPRSKSHQAMQLILSADNLKHNLFFVPLSETVLYTDKCSIREICLGLILSPLENRLFRWKTLVRPTSSDTDGKHFRGLPIIPMETLHRTLMECNFRTYRKT